MASRRGQKKNRQKKTRSNEINWLEAMLVGLVGVVATFWQSQAIGRLVYPNTDEGVYLYAARLVAGGLVPYRDFFLAHFPSFIYLNAMVLKMVGGNIDLYHYCYVVYAVSAAIPLYLFVRQKSRSKVAGFTAMIMLLTAPEIVQWDLHYFAIRQASLPFLMWGIYLLTKKPARPVITAILLAMFAISLFTNYYLVAVLLICWYFFGNREQNTWGRKASIKMGWILVTLLSAHLIMLWRIPNAYTNLFEYQMIRSTVGLSERWGVIRGMLPLNSVWMVTGAVGTIYLLFTREKWLAWFNILSVAGTVLLGHSFLPHYLTIVGLNIIAAAGIALGNWGRNRVVRVGLAGLLLLAIYKQAGQHLRFNLVENSSPDFFAASEVLKTVSDPLLSFEPIYAVYAERELVKHYFMVDPRYFAVMGTGYEQSVMMRLIGESQSILLDPYTASLIEQPLMDVIFREFVPIYYEAGTMILTRR